MGFRFIRLGVRRCNTDGEHGEVLVTMGTASIKKSDLIMTALIADPDEKVYQQAARILGAMSCTCLRAETPRQALDLLLSRKIDLAVVSREFPCEEPGALLEQITGRWQELPVIVTTTSPSVEAAVLCLKSGAIDYLEKPLEAQRLEDIAEGVFEELARNAEHQTREIEIVEEVIGNYKVLDELGAGAVATVYRAVAVHDPDGPQVALKVLRGGIVEDEARRVALERFIREAEMASAVDHPNVVQLVDYGLASEAMLPYIAYELVDGRPLSHYCSTRSLPLREAIRLLEQAAAALAAIHDAGIIHRDFKPDNLLISPDLVLKISDFGVSRRSESDLTRADCTVGTPFYLPPESLGKAPVDARCDQFSLGCVAYELVTGKRPFPGATLAEIIRGIRKRTPTYPNLLDDELPIDLCELIMQLMEKDPNDRFSDCSEVEQRFAACRKNLPLVQFA